MDGARDPVPGADDGGREKGEGSGVKETVPSAILFMLEVADAICPRSAEDGIHLLQSPIATTKS
jgi:hypothetical protein